MGGGYVTKGGVSSENLPNITTELYLYSNLPGIIRTLNLILFSSHGG